MANDFYTNHQLEKLFGKRLSGATTLFEPQELGWNCPVNPRHEICWSEFLDHLWCYDCQKDYFSLLCPKKMNSFTTEEILEEEIAIVKPLMAKWTLKRYKEYLRDLDD